MLICIFIFFFFSYVATMNDSNLNYLSSFLSDYINCDSLIIKDFYISLYWNCFLCYLTFSSIIIKFLSNDSLKSLTIKKLLFELLKNFALVLFVSTILYFLSKILFNDITYELLICLWLYLWVYCNDICFILINFGIFTWSKLFLQKLIYRILAIYSNLKLDLKGWIITKIIFLFNIACARHILVKFTSYFLSPENIIVEILTFNSLVHVFNYLFNNLLQKTMLLDILAEFLKDISDKNLLLVALGVKVNIEANTKNIKIWLDKDNSPNLNQLYFLLSKDLNKESKISIFYSVIQNYTFFGKLFEKNNWYFLLISKSSFSKICNSSYYPSNFQTYTLPQIYPSSAEFNLKKIFSSVILISILNDDHSSQWNSETLVGSDWEGKTVIGSELDLDFKGKSEFCNKFKDPQLNLSAEYIRSSSDIMVWMNNSVDISVDVDLLADPRNWTNLSPDVNLEDPRFIRFVARRLGGIFGLQINDLRIYPNYHINQLWFDYIHDGYYSPEIPLESLDMVISYDFNDVLFRNHMNINHSNIDLNSIYPYEIQNFWDEFLNFRQFLIDNPNPTAGSVTRDPNINILPMTNQEIIAGLWKLLHEEVTRPRNTWYSLNRITLNQLGMNFRVGLSANRERTPLNHSILELSIIRPDLFNIRQVGATPVLKFIQSLMRDN